MSLSDIPPYREHIKKMDSVGVNHSQPIFSEMKWDAEENTVLIHVQTIGVDGFGQ